MTFQRVLIALDPAAPRDEWTDALRALGASGADLLGLYVEDAALLRLASLPCAREVRPGALARQMDTQAVLQQLQRHGAALQLAMERASRSSHLRLRFSVRRGEVGEVLLTAAAEVDLVVIGRSRRSAGVRSWLGSAPEGLLLQPATASLLFIQEPWATGSSIVVLADPTPTGARALQLGRALARAEGLPLVLVNFGAAPGDLPDGVDRRLDVTRAGTAEPDARALRHACRVEDARVLVIPGTATQLGPALADLVSDLPASVILVR